MNTLESTICAVIAIFAITHSAAGALDCDAVTRLLADDPSMVNLKNNRGLTPLLVVIESGIGGNCYGWGICPARQKMIDLLIAAKADLNARSNDGNTVLHYAIRQGLDYVKYFAASNKSLLSATNCFLETPLHVAVGMRKRDVAEYLVLTGSPVNARKDDGFTPLLIAANNHDTDMITMLLYYHADINARTASGKTAYTLAYDPNDSTLQRFLRKHGAHE